MSADPIVGMDIGAAAAALAAGEATPSQLLDTYLERIEALEPTLNCFITITSDLARAQARSADRRHADRRPRSVLDGIPIGLKDNIDVAGIPTTNGTGRAVVADVDARIVTGLKDAGAILVGKLNLHEAALGATTDNPHHGRTVNPHRLGYTPGGSSGGSGAAVAAGLCLAAIGSDTLGSVRLPAAYCGVVGFKPSPRHGGCQGVAPLMPELDTLGPLARTVRDAGAGLGVRQRRGVRRHAGSCRSDPTRAPCESRGRAAHAVDEAIILDHRGSARSARAFSS